jgi:hypothetical protein
MMKKIIIIIEKKMKLSLTLSLLLLLSDTQARVIDVADEDMRGPPSPSRFEGPGGIKHTKTQAPVNEGTVSLSPEEEDEKTSSALVGGDPSTTPGANTPGGGVPRLGEGYLNPPLPVQLPWWERWWNSIAELFS